LEGAFKLELPSATLNHNLKEHVEICRNLKRNRKELPTSGRRQANSKRYFKNDSAYTNPKLAGISQQNCESRFKVDFERRLIQNKIEGQLTVIHK
jgi:hypothetical protein